MKTQKLLPLLAALACAPLCDARAHDADNDSSSPSQAPIRADSHAPIGVMGDHMHKAGEIMLSYRFMHMDMQGNRIGTDGVSPEDIVTSVANPHAGPANLRVVPSWMTMDMHMVGAMYAPTDWLTLMIMGSYIEKEMELITFAGMSGTDRLGKFTTRSAGIGDTKLSGLLRLFENETHHLHANLGISVPTGSIDEVDDVLTPMGTNPTMVLPYGMQLGTGTFDLLPGLTYTGHSERFGWGAQLTGRFHLGENDADYSWGDKGELTVWGSYLIDDWISTSLRVTGKTEGRINGSDDRITAPVQTADPDNYGGERVDVSFGVNLAAQEGFLRGHRLGLELTVPVYQDLNGPQMETDWGLTAGWQLAF